MKKVILLSILIWLACATLALAIPVRAKDVVKIKGLSDTQLIGYGLVVGLPGTGDRFETIISDQTLKNLLEKFGISISKDRLYTRNTAAVMVTAALQPFSKKGDLVDVNVSALGDAKSLTGGTLLLTTLRGPDGQTYASTQGALTVGGYEINAEGFTFKRNFPVAGKLSDGGVVLADQENSVLKQEELSFVIKNGDFELVQQLAAGINGLVKLDAAIAEDATTVRLKVPAEYRDKIVDLVTMVNGLTLNTSEEARIVVNERTGTVVIGENVKVSPVAVSHGDLVIKIKKTTKTSQPLPFTLGQTTQENEIQETVREEDKHLVMLDNGTTIQDVVNALNSIGATPRDVIAILQAIKAAGALKAKIEII
jgi:flagellar P-ring protein precursor FlgI